VGVAVITADAATAGAVQMMTLLSGGVKVPSLAVQAAGTEEAMATSSLTPTRVRESAVPSGAFTEVRVVIVQEGAGACVGGGEGGGVTRGAVGAVGDSGAVSDKGIREKS
jgi:hypothetical protein